MQLEDIKKNLFTLKSYKKAGFEYGDGDKNGPQVEGITFRYKTVQYHLLDNFFEELKKNPKVFGDLKIYEERFSLPGFGKKEDNLTGEEYQFEVTLFIESKSTSDAYFEALKKVADTIEEKHDVNINVTQYEEDKPESSYNVHKITFYTNEKGIFSDK